MISGPATRGAPARFRPNFSMFDPSIGLPFREPLDVCFPTVAFCLRALPPPACFRPCRARPDQAPVEDASGTAPGRRAPFSFDSLKARARKLARHRLSGAGTARQGHHSRGGFRQGPENPLPPRGCPVARRRGRRPDRLFPSQQIFGRTCEHFRAPERYNRQASGAGNPLSAGLFRLQHLRARSGSRWPSWALPAFG